MKDKKIILYLIFEVLFILILLGVLLEKLSFGVGLGDLFYVVIGLILVVVSCFLFFVFPTKRKWILMFMFVCLLYYLMALTIFRGAEFPWDGNLFR